MRLSQQKTGTEVRNGKVARKNRTDLSNHYSQLRQTETVFDRWHPVKNRLRVGRKASPNEGGG